MVGLGLHSLHETTAQPTKGDAMIVEPDFLDHWKTRLLVRLLGTELAPIYVIRLWAHCQSRKTDRFTDWKPTVLASVCRWETDPQTLWDAMLETYLERDGNTVVARGWAETNAGLISAWTNGKLGGRPKKQAKPTDQKPAGNRPDNRIETVRVTDREDRSREDREDREDISPLTPQGGEEVIEKPKRSPWEVKFGLELPERLRTDECIEAAKLWLAYKAERRQGYKPIGLKAALTEWGNEYTAEQFPRFVQHSIAKNYQGIHPPRANSHQQSLGDNRYQTATADDAAF